MTIAAAIPSSILTTVVFAVLLSPLPKRLGVYEALFSLHPMLVGLYPSSMASEASWGYTFDDLYAPSDDDDGDSPPRPRLRKQTAIVTGANSGIGYEISLALARLGADVTMACRNPDRCEAAAAAVRADPAAAGTVSTAIVDVGSLSSVREFCRGYLKEHRGRSLDMLFLNAAIKHAPVHADGVSLHLSEDGIETTFATNVVGHHLMYKLLEPRILRSSKNERTTPARVVQTSSAVSYLVEYPHKVATDLETLNGATARDPDLYHQSKLAQVLWGQELTARLDAAGNDGDEKEEDPNAVVYVNTANPGAVATKIWDDATWSDDGLSGLFWQAFTAFHRSNFMWTPAEGALTPLYVGTAVDDLEEKRIRGRYYHPQSKPMEDHVLFPGEDNARQTLELRRKLWTFLDELVADFV